MKKSLLVAALVLFLGSLEAQIISVRKTFINAVTYQTNSTINSEVNKGVNAIFNAPGKIFNKVKRSNANTNTNGNGNVNTNTNTSVNTGVMNNPQDSNSAGMIGKAV